MKKSTQRAGRFSRAVAVEGCVGQELADIVGAERTAGPGGFVVPDLDLARRGGQGSLFRVALKRLGGVPGPGPVVGKRLGCWTTRSRMPVSRMRDFPAKSAASAGRTFFTARSSYSVWSAPSITAFTTGSIWPRGKRLPTTRSRVACLDSKVVRMPLAHSTLK